MKQVTFKSNSKLPENDKGYIVSAEERKEKHNKTESYIPKQNILTGVNATLHQLTNDIFTYFPKGFQGSKNSDFYEFLALGKIPYLIGSAMLIALYCGVNNKFNPTDAFAGSKVAKRMGAGVVLYGIGKWLSQKLSRIAIKHSTGVDLDMRYIKKIPELPEPGQEKGIMRNQRPGVFDSVNFYRNDLLEQDSEFNEGNMYAYYDKIAKKAGFKNDLNAPNQVMGPKIRQLKARTTALENVSKYVAAACGVALGSQKAFENIKFSSPFKNQKAIIETSKSILTALKDGAKQLWQGTNKNLVAKNFGKVLIVATGISTLLTWLIPAFAFKSNPDTMKSKVDTKKEFEVC